MSVEIFTDGLEPENPDAILWRFLQPFKFEDLMINHQLYFRRADLFLDESEGLPPEEYLSVLNLDPLDIRDRQEMNHHVGSVAQFRESFFLNCWYLFNEESAEMWKQYAENGVAICTRYNLFKEVLESCEGRFLIGLVRYGSSHLTGWNVVRFISTKKKQYAHEKEFRAALWQIDPTAGINRHFDANNRAHDRPLTPPSDSIPKGITRKVDIQKLVSEIVLSPWVSEKELQVAETLVRNNGLKIPIRLSDLTRYKHLLP